MPESFIYICPFCSQELECEAETEGKTASCPSCKQKIVLSKPESKNPTCRFIDNGIAQSDKKHERCSSVDYSSKNDKKRFLAIGILIGLVVGLAVSGCLFCVMRKTIVNRGDNTAKSIKAKNTGIKHAVTDKASKHPMLQLTIKSPDWSNPTTDMLAGMIRNDFAYNLISPIVNMLEKLFPKSWSLSDIRQASACTIDGEPGQLYIQENITDSGSNLAIIIQEDDSDDQYDFMLYATEGKKVFLEFAVYSSFTVAKIHSMLQRLDSSSNKKKSEKMERSSYSVNGRNFYGSAELFFEPSSDKSFRFDFYDDKNGSLKNVEMNGQEFRRFSMALLYAHKILNDHHLKRFYWVKTTSSK